MVKWFRAKVFSIVDWSHDLSTMVKWFCAKVFSIVGWSCDLLLVYEVVVHIYKVLQVCLMMQVVKVMKICENGGNGKFV